MPRVRKHDRHLPPRMRLRSGTYYLVEQAHGRSRWHNLGSDYSEALRAWAEAETADARVTTVDDLLTHYLTACVTRAPATLTGYRQQGASLSTPFGSLRLEEVRRADIARYMSLRGGVIANRERDLFRAAWNWALNAGLTELPNPMAGMRRRNPERKRTRYVTDAELEALEGAANGPIRPLLRFLYLTGMRLGDALRLPLSAAQADGVHWVTGKTRTPQHVRWSPALRRVWSMAAQGRQTGPLFVSRLHKPYTVQGVEAIFQRLRVRAGVADVRLHDLRRKAASDIPLEHAQRLLGHASPGLTRQRYKVRADPVKPVR